MLLKNIKILVKTIRGCIGYSLLVLNILSIAIIFCPIGYIKKKSKNINTQKKCLYLLHKLGELWISINYYIVKIVGSINIQTDFNNTDQNILNNNNSYILISNHQSWTDIFILQFILNKKIPFQKYLAKQQLRKLPVMGYVWESIDCPFLARTKDKTSFDLDIIKKSCDKLKLAPSTIACFLEGSRFTIEKHRQQKSPYKNLLIPKTGGLACLLEAMGDNIKYIVDVSISYKPKNITFWDLFCGNLELVNAQVNVYSIPEWLKSHHENNTDYSKYKQDLDEWINSIWLAKDKYLEQFN